MATVVQPDEFAKILDDLGEDYLDVAEAVRRLCILETEPTRYNCGTCRFFRGGVGKRPGQLPCSDNPLTVRCDRYEYRDKRDEALPVGAVVAQKHKSKMFK
jgi:hypothetical protein